MAGLNSMEDNWSQPPGQGSKALLLAFFSIFAGVVLGVVPVSIETQSWWPRWLALILLYWIIMPMPFVKVGIWMSAAIGLLMDYLTGTPLGQQMMAYAVFARMALLWHNRFRQGLNILTLFFMTFVLLLALETVNWLVALIFAEANIGTAWAAFKSILSGVLISPIIFMLFNWFLKPKRRM